MTLGWGPSGFPRKLSRRRLTLPRQPGRGASLALASVILALGAGPLGFPKQLSGATAEASATAMANPRRRSRALRYSGARGWPVGLPERIFRVTAKASATASLALASVVLALGGVRAADGRFHIVPYKEFISGQAKPFLSNPCRIATLSRPASRSGRFAKPRRGASLALASVILALGAGPLLPETTYPKLPRQPWQTRAVARTRSVILALGWPVGLPETIFRATAKASATASLALASVVLALGWPDGLPETSFRAMKAEGSWKASGRNGRFIYQTRTNCQISKFGLQIADFILSRIRSLSAAKPSHYYQGLAE